MNPSSAFRHILGGVVLVASVWGSGCLPAVAAQDEDLVSGLRELVLRLLHDGRGRMVAAERKRRGVAGGGVEGEVEGAWLGAGRGAAAAVR